MIAPAPSFLERLRTAADDAEAAEGTLRRDFAQRLKAAEAERAFAYRRLNLMRAVAEAVVAAEDAESAVAGAIAVLRSRLGWATDSEARDAVQARFAPVAQAIVASLSPGAADAPAAEAADADVVAALAEFEAWYANTHPVPFWALFETYLPETPVVDF